MKKILFIWAILLFSTLGWAQVVQVKGVGTASYSGWVTGAAKEKAYQAAQVAAVERYFAENGEAESQNFESIQDKIEANLDKFILSTTVINEQDQSNLHKYSVAVRVELNVAKLRNTLRGSSATAKAASGAKSQLVYLFVGREVSSVKEFDARTVQRMEAEGSLRETGSESISGREGESISDSSISTSASRRTKSNYSSKASMRVETGGSTTRKADQTSYRLLPMNNVKTAITSVFSQGGYVVADPEFVLGDKEYKVATQDFAAGNDLKPGTMRAVVATLKKNQVPLFVLATLDVGAPAVDAASGLPRVAVVVTGRVLDLSNSLPREVASVPAVQYFGVGPDNASAMNKGLKDAALAAAREVVSRLNAAGVY